MSMTEKQPNMNHNHLDVTQRFHMILKKYWIVK